MLKFDQFRIVNLQIGIFTPGLQLRPNRVIAALAESFDGNSTVLPFGEDVPQEVPRLILSTADDRYKFQASNSRADLLTSGNAVDVAHARTFAASAIAAYLDATRAVVGRLAGGLKRAAETDSPGLELARHFCRDEWLHGPLNRPEDFELHAHKRFQLGSRWSVNSWMRCKTAKLAASNAPIVLVEQDLNTLAEEIETQDFRLNDIQQFIADCSPEFEHILQLYFPGRPRA
jgi:hypothetical protein